jgi:hypothetical protein
MDVKGHQGLEHTCKTSYIQVARKSLTLSSCTRIERIESLFLGLLIDEL